MGARRNEKREGEWEVKAKRTNGVRMGNSGVIRGKTVAQVRNPRKACQMPSPRGGSCSG